MCKSDLDSVESTSGPCADYVKCVTACSCDATCAGACMMSDACTAAYQKVVTCTQSSCLAQTLSCVGAGGTGGAGGGFNFGGNGGALNVGGSTATETCADLSACCTNLTDANSKMACTTIVSGKDDQSCGVAYGALCGP